MYIIIIIIGAIIVLLVYRSRRVAKKRKEMLLAKYKDEKLVEMIIGKQCWEGQTKEQLLDSLGRPEDIDTKVMKTKKKEVWKYYQIAKNRYGFKVTIEDGMVVGWEEKS